PPAQIGGGLYEADGDHVDAERQAEAQVVGVLRRDARDRQRHAGRRDALVLANRAAFDDDRVNVPAVDAADAQLDAAVVEQQPIAWTDAVRETRERRGQPARLAGRVVDRDRERLAGLDDDGLAAFDGADADFRSAEILQDRDFTAGPLRRGADARERCRVRLLRAVREVETEDVGAGRDQRVEHAVGLARGPD